MAGRLVSVVTSSFSRVYPVGFCSAGILKVSDLFCLYIEGVRPVLLVY